MKKIVTGIMLILLLIGIWILPFNVQLAKPEPGTIYLRADGSVDPLTAPISTVDNITYTFTDDIYDSIVVERDNIVIDGASYTLQGTEIATAIDLSYRFNVTIKNVSILNFTYGIALYYSSSNRIVENYIEGKSFAIRLDRSSNNSIVRNDFLGSKYEVALYDSLSNDVSGNKMKFTGTYAVYLSNSSSNRVSGNIMTYCRNGIHFDNSSNKNVVFGNYIAHGGGIDFHMSSNNTISGNSITAWWEPVAYDGINLVESSNNTISGNSVATKEWECVKLFQSSNNNIISNNNITAELGICIVLSFSSGNAIVRNNIEKGHYGICFYSSPNNMVYHNNFINNTWSQAVSRENNTWDNGYPSGGNYWSDYIGTDVYSGAYQNETGSDGIGDAPYIIDVNNRDVYPLANPWIPPDIAVMNVGTSKTVIGQGLSINVNVTLTNQGNKVEGFSVQVYANVAVISSRSIILTNGSSINITFSWNTTGFAEGNYTIWAVTDIVLGETDISDNTLPDGWVVVTIPGDVDGDFDVDIFDVVKITNVYYSEVGDPEYRPNSDIDGDGVIDIYDAVICTSHYGQYYP